MGELIHVNFKHRCRTEYRADELYFGFLDILRQQGLDEDDIADVLDAIRDPEYYAAADDVVKTIVDAYYTATV